MVVCPYSTGCVIVQEIQRRGYKVIALWPKGFSEEMKSHVPVSCGTMQYYAVETVGDDSGETSRERTRLPVLSKLLAAFAAAKLAST